LAGSSNNLSIGRDGLGRREEALQASEEAVALYRDLAAARPDAFRPGLAMSCGAHGNVLRNMGDHVTAAERFLEGVKTIEPMFLALPDAFLQLTGALLQDYVRSMQEVALQPDEAALSPIIGKMIEIGVINPDDEDT